MEIGYINAYISGDYRYGSSVRVNIEENGDVTIERKENGAVGGMDGNGAAFPYQIVYSHVISSEKVTPSNVVKEIKKSFDDIIKLYGKPTKSFVWLNNNVCVAVGLSVAKAKKALEL